jgi:hypothetical protein
MFGRNLAFTEARLHPKPFSIRINNVQRLGRVPSGNASKDCTLQGHGTRSLVVTPSTAHDNSERPEEMRPGRGCFLSQFKKGNIQIYF